MLKIDYFLSKYMEGLDLKIKMHNPVVGSE